MKMLFICLKREKGRSNKRYKMEGVNQVHLLGPRPYFSLTCVTRTRRQAATGKLSSRKSDISRYGPSSRTNSRACYLAKSDIKSDIIDDVIICTIGEIFVHNYGQRCVSHSFCTPIISSKWIDLQYIPIFA